MAQQNLRSLLEAVAATANLKNAAGEIRDPQTLLESGALAKLDARHPGAYVIFLFDAMADPSIAAYLATGSLSTDSGSLILALYERLPKAGARADVAGVPGLSIEAENPIVAFGRALFPKTLLTLPSLLVVKRLAATGACVSVALEGNTPQQVALSVRKTMALVTKALTDQPGQGDFAQVLGVVLSKAGVTYVRSDGKSPEEHFARLLRSLWGSRRDLAALVPVVGKLFAGKPTGGDV